MSPRGGPSGDSGPSRHPSADQSSTDSATAPVVGVVVLVGIVTIAAAALAAGLTGADVLSQATAEPSRVALAASANASDDRVTLVHRGGDALVVEDLWVHVAVDGTPLTHQPPVPFFAAKGFQSGPTGPFNVGGNTRWTAGESASFAIAGTNAPQLEPGSEVLVRIYSDELKVAELQATA